MMFDSDLTTAVSSTQARANDAERLRAFGFGGRLSPDDAPDLKTLVRWGWLPLVVGCIAIVTLAVVASELAFARLGYAEPDPSRRVLFIARAALTSGALAAWAGWYVLRIRRRIEAVRTALLQHRRELEARALRAEQAAGVGAYSRILAHEVRSPLNAIAIHSELLTRRLRGVEGADPSLLETVAVVQAETARLKTLIDDYIAFGRPSDVVVRPVATKLDVIVRTIADAITQPGDGRPFAIDAPDDLPQVRADERSIADATHHLLRRAWDSSPHGRTIGVALRSDGPCVSVTIRDEGPSFADPGALFRPFFTTADAGFGLAIVRDIVRAHGGDIQASNDAHGRPTVVMRIPKA